MYGFYVPFLPFFKKHRPASDKFGISCEQQNGKQYKKESDRSLCKTEI